MDVDSAVERFKTILKEQPDTSPAIGALTVLLEFMNQDDSKTVQGLKENLDTIVNALVNESGVTSVSSASEIFKRFITFTSLEHSDFNECKKVLSGRGVKLIDKLSESRVKISKYAQTCIRDNMNILIHSHSRVVYDALLEAHNRKKNFHVYVTESAPDFSGRVMYEKLQNAGIDCTLIIDAAVSYIMGKITLVFLGAEGVTQNGGIVNKIGTYGIAVIAKSMNKSVYVLAESFKFVKISPANQRDLPNEFTQLNIILPAAPEKALIDFTPSSYLTLVITDISTGYLTTAAVVDEFIKLYV